MQKMLLSLVFALYGLGFGTGGSASRSGPSFLMPKAGKTSLIDRKSDSFAVAEADLYNPKSPTPGGRVHSTAAFIIPGQAMGSTRSQRKEGRTSC